MASNAGIFLAGVGTTFIILGAGFAGGLMMATSALKEPTGFQNRASAEPPSPVRVILPSTAEAAEPPQASQQIATAPEPPLPPPVKEAQAPVERQVEKVDTRKAEAEQRERRKRYAERKAKRQAERAKRQQQIEQGEHQEAPIMALAALSPDEAVASASSATRGLLQASADLSLEPTVVGSATNGLHRQDQRR